MGTTASAPANRSEGIAGENDGKSSGLGLRQWRKKYTINRRQRKTVQTLSEVGSQLGTRASRTSKNPNAATSTLSSSAVTDPSASSTEGTLFPVATTTAQLLPMEMPLPESEASYQITKHKYEELGCMPFHFVSFHNATNYSRTTRKPVLLVQAEIPGDTEAGTEIFSHPLIVEAADSLFITVFNKGEDYSCSASRSASMKSHRTRVGFFDELGNAIVPSLSADMLTRAGMAEAMIATLEACERPIPKYLKLLYDEERGRIKRGPVGLLLYDEERGRIKRGPFGLPAPCCHRAVFGMDDSIRGEVEFAGLEGVISTRAGFLTLQKVVEVIYDSSRLDFASVTFYALNRNIGDIIYYQTNDERNAAVMAIARVEERSTVTEFLGTIRLDADSKPALRRTLLQYVPLTELQATRANRLVHLERFNEAMHLLSPRQELICMQAESMATRTHNSFKNVVDVSIFTAWMSLCDEQVQANGAAEGVAGGASEGDTEGMAVGDTDGATEGMTDGPADGLVDGSSSSGVGPVVPGIVEGPADGDTEGMAEGETDGDTEGIAEGAIDGSTEGTADGAAEGVAGGASEGNTKGMAVGDTDGATEGMTDGPADGLVDGSSSSGVGPVVPE
jgi:hypothetical protein